MNHLSQFIVEVPSFESVFDVDFLKKLCHLHDFSKKELAGFETYTPYK